MEEAPFHHPRRFLGNAPGPFYTLGEGSTADCLACGTPEAAAPELLASAEGENANTYFLRQPSTPEEVEAACQACEVCCVSALRYGGRDLSIIKRLGNNPGLCDFVVDQRGELVATVASSGRLLPEFERSVGGSQRAVRNAFTVKVGGHVVRWHMSWQTPNGPTFWFRSLARRALPWLALALAAAAAGFAARAAA